MAKTEAERRAYIKQWQIANAEKCAAYRLVSQAKRKLKWDEFLATERDRYKANRIDKLAAQKARRDADPEKFKARVRQSYYNDPTAALANYAARRARKLNATPAWADRAAIRAIYAEARRLTKSTGVQHEVDHIYPLKGRTCCGLHVPSNLQIITRDANRRKFTKVELPTESAVHGVS